MFRAAIDAGTDIGRRVEPILAAGELVPDELTVGLIRDRLDERRATAASCSTAFRATRRRATRSTSCCASSTASSTRSSSSTSPTTSPPSACSGAPARSTAPTTRPRRSRTGSTSTTRDTEPVVEHYRVDGQARAAPRRPLSADEVWVEIQQALDQVGARRVIIRKSAHEIELMARAGEVVAGTLALMEERLEPGISMAELDRDRRRVHPLAGRRPDLEGLQGLSRPRRASRRTR